LNYEILIKKGEYRRQRTKEKEKRKKIEDKGLKTVARR
jgi:hypothetical protein